MKNSFFFRILLVFLTFQLCSHAQSPPPGISWKRSDRLNYYPPQLTTIPSYDIDFFAEDWWYDHKNSYAGGEVSAENFDGFITCGYSAIRNSAYSEDNDGCLLYTLASPPSPPVLCDNHLPFENFEDPDGYLGHTTFQIMAKYDPYGKLQWFKSYNQLWFIRVIQTSDGNYVAVGPTGSTRQQDNSSPIYYNPTTANPDDAFGASYGNDCGSSYDRKVNVVKIDPQGNIIWNYIYGVKPISDPDCAMERYMPYDLVEYDQGTDPKIRIVGRFDPHSSGSALGYESAFMIDINSDDGYFNWAESFDPSNTSGSDKRYFKAIEKIFTGSGEFLAVTGTEEQSGQKILDVMYVNASSNSPVSPVWQKYFNGLDNPTTSMSYPQTDVFDVCFNSNGDLLVPLLYNCNDCGYLDNWSEAAVFKLNKTNGSVITQYPISDGTAPEDLARAFDLMIGITNTSDGGFAIVTSKRPEEYSVRYHPFTVSWPCNGGLDESSYSYWGADAFVRKFDANGNVEWSKIWDNDDAEPALYPGDTKKQECMYSITETPDGGLVVSGNNSRNFDDCYLVKLYDNCQNVDRRYDSDDWSQDEIIDMTELASALGSPLLSNNYTIRGSLVIADGETLEINNGAVIEFADTRKCGIITNLVVEEGGTLIIHEGATLTSLSACDNSMWDGVQLWGDNSIDQSSGQANMFISDNATIENARVGILGDKGNYVQHENIPGPNQAMIKDLVLEGHQTHGGALLQADDAIFRNNRFSVVLHAYPGEVNNSYINTSNFILDQPINDFDAVNQNGDRLGINTFIVLFDVHGVVINDNEFEISHSFNLTNDRGIGIGAFDSEFQLTQNDFFELEAGLAAGASNSLNTFAARCNLFDNVVYGMDVREIDFMEVHNNTFDLTPSNPPAIVSSFGIYLDDCTGYMLEQNTINNNNTTGIYLGIINNYSTPNNFYNEIEHNTITYCNYSLLLQGEHLRQLSSNLGLQIGCNELQGYDYAIAVTVAPGIAGQQGGGNGANNMFSSSGCTMAEGQVYNPSGMNPIDYHHKQNSTTEYVELVSGCYTSPTQVIPNPINIDFERPVDCNYAYLPCSPQFFTSNTSTQSQQQNHLRVKLDSANVNPDDFFNQKMRGYLHDKNYRGGIDSIIQLLQTQNGTDHLLANAYAKAGRTSSLSSELNRLESNANFLTFVNSNRLINGLEWSQLKSNDSLKTLLFDFAMDSSSFGYNGARNVLRSLYGETFDPYIVLPVVSHQLRKAKEEPLQSIKVYPNPFTSSLSVVIPSTEDSYDVRIYDMLGKELMNNTVSGSQHHVMEMHSIANGLYVIRVSLQDQIIFSQLINRLAK